MFVFLNIIILILILMMGISLYNMLMGPFLNKAPAPQSYPKVSVLVPARNEEKHISRCLMSLANQDYPDYEIIILDDASTDNTASLISQFVSDYPQAVAISVTDVPEGWTGKNWACYQLARRASGKYIIFTDADTWHEPAAIRQTIAWMQHLQLGMCSAFSQQITESLAEKLIIPIVDVIVYGALPLWSTYRFKSPAFAAANGQWIAFLKEAYLKFGGHKAVRNEIVEDVQLSRVAKKNRIPLLTLAGTGSVYCRMYSGWSEIWTGLSKNLYGITGYHPMLFIGMSLALISVTVFPYFLIFFPRYFLPSLIAIVLNMMLRLLIAIRYRHHILETVILHPIGIFLAMVIALNSFLQVKKGRVFWKGRTININRSKK